MTPQVVQRLVGVVERVTYVNSSNGWSVIKVSPMGETAARYRAHVLALKGLVLAAGLLTLPLSCQEEHADEATATARGGEPGPGVGSALLHAPRVRVPSREPSELAPLAAVPSEQPSVAELAELLDLVPADSESFVGIRDLRGLFRTLDAGLRGADHEALAALWPQWDASVAQRMAGHISGFESHVVGSSVRLEAGALVLPRKQVMVFGGAPEDADRLTEAIAALGVSGDGLPVACIPLPHAPGFIGCGEDEAVLSTFQPGRRGLELRAELAGALPSFDLDEANIVLSAKVGRDTVAAVISTWPGRIHAAFAGPGFEDVSDFAEAGPPRALGLLREEAPLLWTRLPAALVRDADSVPPELRALADTLTGEVALGGLPDGSVAFLVGVDDPFPASGLVSILSLRPEVVLESLPPGAELKAERVEAAQGTLAALHVGYDAGPIREFATRFGLKADLWGFAGGEYAALVLGGNHRSIATVADYESRTSVPAWLPAELRHAINAGICVLAIHLPLDALHEREGRELFLSSFQIAGGFDVVAPDKLSAVLDALTPISSATGWMTLDHGRPIVHVAADFFGDPTTAEGIDALTALKMIADGAASATTYERLASEWAASRHAARYQDRAHPRTTRRDASLLEGLAFGLLMVAQADRPRSRRKTPARSRTPRRPIALVKANAIYAPGPDRRKLAAAAKERSPGTGKVAFCLSSGGKVERVKTAKRFRGGRERAVDRLLVETVSKWRFKPLMKDGRPQKVCTVAEFSLRFD